LKTFSSDRTDRRGNLKEERKIARNEEEKREVAESSKRMGRARSGVVLVQKAASY